MPYTLSPSLFPSTHHAELTDAGWQAFVLCCCSVHSGEVASNTNYARTQSRRGVQTTQIRCLRTCSCDPSKLPAGLPSPFLRCRYCGTVARKSTRHILTAWTTTRLVPPPCWYTCRTWSRAAKQPSRTASGSALRCQRLSAPSRRVPRWAVQPGACEAAAAVVLSRCQLAVIAASKPASSQPGSSQTRQAVLPVAQLHTAVKSVGAAPACVLHGPLPPPAQLQLLASMFVRRARWLCAPDEGMQWSSTRYTPTASHMISMRCTQPAPSSQASSMSVS